LNVKCNGLFDGHFGRTLHDEAQIGTGETVRGFRDNVKIDVRCNG